MRLLACSWLLIFALVSAQGATTLSEDLIALSGRPLGICSMPRGGDGKLSIELAQKSKLLVCALNETPEEVTAARKAAEEAGLYGRSVYVEQGSVAHNPLMNWAADVLVIADASDADLTQIPQKEISRVLSPYRGVAVVGRAKALGPGLSRAQLESWLAGLNAPEGKIVEDDFGMWAVATMPPLAGGDDWTHYAHGVDQNRVSADEAFRAPFQVQYAGKPFYDGKFDIVVASSGRMFRAESTLSIEGHLMNGVVARNIYNGTILWRRETADDFGTFGSLIVAMPDKVYLKDGNGVLVLDAETGKELKRYALSEDPGIECRWLMVQDGVLVTVLGAKPVDSLRKLEGVQTLKKTLAISDHEAARQWFQDYDQGTALVATELASGKELWRIAAKVDPAKTVISGNRLFYYGDRTYAACVDLKSGQSLWKSQAPIEKNPKGTGWEFTAMATPRVGALLTPDIYYINSYKDGHYQAFSTSDGKILWGGGHGRTDEKDQYDKNLPGGMSYPVFINGHLLDKGGHERDPLTGQRLGDTVDLKYTAVDDICGPFSTTNHYILGGGGPAYDLDSKTKLPLDRLLKAACLSGPVLADGVLTIGHGNCEGCREWYGHVAFSSGSAAPTGDQAPPEERLVAGTPLATTEGGATASDWVTYRANNSRSCSSTATVPAKASLLWTWTPNPLTAWDETIEGMETSSSPAVCVGDSVYFGTATGSVRSLARKTGQEQWSYLTGGRIISSPTFWEGKLYVGSGDGWVYCLNASNGSLVWRYRVAPVERQTMIYGNLMSAWPVNANVLVQPVGEGGQGGAVAYATAGFIGAYGGSFVCALDARSGKPLWETPLCEPAPTTSSGSPAKTFKRLGDGKAVNLAQSIDASGPGCAPEALYHSMFTAPEATYLFDSLKAGSPYTVRLHFVEPWEKEAGKRLIDVTVNGQKGLENFDILAESGGQNKAIAKELAATADEKGGLAVRFVSSDKKNNIVVSGIEVLDGGKAVAKVQTGGVGVPQAGFLGDGENETRPEYQFPSANGQLAWYQGKLWLHTGDDVAYVVDATTGKVVPAIDPGGYALPLSTYMGTICRGQDIGIMPGGWVTLGGKIIFGASYSQEQARNTAGFILASPDGAVKGASGYPEFLIYKISHERSSIPVWDDKETLFLGPPAVLLTNFDKALSADAAAHPPAVHEIMYGGNARSLAEPAWPPANQRPALPTDLKNSELCYPILAANAVIYLSGNSPGVHIYGTPSKVFSWTVTAVNRADATLLWQCPLPDGAIPAASLSLSSAGDVLVPCVDGRVFCIGAGT